MFNSIKKVLERLRIAGLYVSIKKSFFHVKEVEYLGYRISHDVISMSDEKAKAVKNWPTPRNIKEVQAFLDFANFYRQFIEGFSRICNPLTDHLRKNTKFYWNEASDRAFELLKDKFSSTPILAHFDPDLPTKVETDASNFAKSSILLQLSTSDNKWYPVAFYSKKMSQAELNYNVHDKELEAIDSCFEE
jgi:hypothetical protein